MAMNLLVTNVYDHLANFRLHILFGQDYLDPAFIQLLPILKFFFFFHRGVINLYVAKTWFFGSAGLLVSVI